MSSFSPVPIICNAFILFLCCFTVLYQDFDGDEYLGKEDMKLTLQAITANELTDEEVEFVTEKVTGYSQENIKSFLVKGRFKGNLHYYNKLTLNCWK